MKRGHLNFLVVKNNRRKIQVSFEKISKLSVLNSELIKNYLLNIVEKPRTELLISLAGIRFIDSASFDILNLVARVAVKYKSTVILKDVEPDTMELIELVKEHYVFNIKYVEPIKEKQKVA